MMDESISSSFDTSLSQSYDVSLHSFLGSENGEEDVIIVQKNELLSKISPFLEHSNYLKEMDNYLNNVTTHYNITLFINL